MERRQFIRNMGLAGMSHGLVGKLLASEACCSLHAPAIEGSGGVPPLKLLQGLTLSEFTGEQEENPRLVTNSMGGNWLFSLHRQPYPDTVELISCFSLEQGEWVEQEPVTPKPGEYEAVTASCGKGGEPVVAWTCRQGDAWTIQVARRNGKAFGYPWTFRPFTGRYINPVLISPGPDRHWLAWECYEKGHFSICLAFYSDGTWSSPVRIGEECRSLFDPAMAEGPDGSLYLAYGITDGVHQNIEMKQVDGSSMSVLKTIAVAIGGGLQDRVNINSKPALAFDRDERLWISWENNRRTHRLEDADNFTGDRICAVVCYRDGRIMEPVSGGKWLFDGQNDHLPTFVKDASDNLYLATHCGGDFTGNPFWKYRLSWLSPDAGWTHPVTIHETKQKGETSRPALIFDDSGHFWLATNPEQFFEGKRKQEVFDDEALNVRASKLDLLQFRAPVIRTGTYQAEFRNSVVEENHPTRNFFPLLSGRPRMDRRQLTYRGETYTLLLGNLHEHSENSSCWPAGCDGTLHDDYRFGLYSEGYDFLGMTDHGYSLTELYWRKNLRIADFYDDPQFFVCIPAMEWTLSNGARVEIGHGVGHKNVIFPSTGEAMKFIRNKHEIFSWHSPETENAQKLWEYLHRRKIDCVTIPHHPADEVHASDWDVHDPHYETVVEIFQCRGNAEYPGCPRELNVSRHRPTPNRKAFIDYALRDRKYKMGFMASGDHNGIGVGIAALWVREVSREGIVDALRNRRCFATTGDKIYVDFRVNGAWGGDDAVVNRKEQNLTFEVEAVQPVSRIEILRNSRVIKVIEPGGGQLSFKGEFSDTSGDAVAGAYYYLRATQDNNHIAWSSPVWLAG